MTNPAQIKIDVEKAAAWMKKGAQPTDTVRILLKKAGAAKAE
ncbi:30S ribosomal protein S16 [bioreactor metagenome]|uniref:30S ribosomal protein S16 n=1 Tax=bioreactor metagenome TaxID=1076179 RepID=A0A645GIJ5_9ZZZZ